MITGGIDLGSLSAKAVLIKNNTIIGSKVIRTGVEIDKIAIKVFKKALDQANLSIQDVDYIISTGYGRSKIVFADENLTEITCHAIGINWFLPKVRTLLDMGGQDCKAIRCNNEGKVTDFILNDKCAAGTGRFFERIAKSLNVPLKDIGERSLQIVKEAAKINSTCAVFGQVDAESLSREGTHINDILAGCCESVVNRVSTLLNQIGIEKEFSISGGIAKNVGIVKRMENLYNLKAKIVHEPQIVGALGAAILASRREKFIKDGAIKKNRRTDGFL